MTWIALVRHGVTEWNERGLLQGRTDIPLSAAGAAKLQQVRPCDAFLRTRWATSPLQRAVQSAAILNPKVKAEIHPELIETNWGKFEGMRRDQLAAHICDLALVPQRGIDLTPPAGESPRMVQKRLTHWFEKIAAMRAPMVAVTHKGIIRSALSIACDWDMNSDFEQKPDWALPHIFQLASDGKPHLVCLNHPWEETPRFNKTNA